jgi:Mn2+/Fe2+ NRAMP family transporter
MPDRPFQKPAANEVKQPPRLKHSKVLGPGLITGASDDDPSGIATYSQSGGQFGYGIGWTMLFTYPLMCAIQLISAEIGRVTGLGQAGEEVEKEKEDPTAQPLKIAPEQARAELRRIRIDTYIGMAFSNLVALAIIITTAATLHAHGITNIATSSQAAQALKPIAGRFAFTIFSIGIIGTGLLTVPVLAGSAAYALGEALRGPLV